MNGRRVRPAIERMTGFDAGFLYMETPSVHMHTLKIAILEADDALSYDAFVAGILARLKRLPPLRRRVVEVPFGLNHPVWVTQPRIDVPHHIRRHRIGGDGSMHELEQLIGIIASTPLHRDRPLWELHYCEGLEGGKVAVVGKMHHALADGAAANALLANVTDVRSAATPEAVQEEYATTDKLPSRIDLLRHAWADAARQLLDLPDLLRRTFLGVRGVVRARRAGARAPVPVLHAPRVSFNGALTPLRSFATVTLPLAELKRIRAQHEGVTLNDIVLATASGALRRWLAAHDEHPASSLLAGVPVSTDERVPSRVSAATRSPTSSPPSRPTSTTRSHGCARSPRPRPTRRRSTPSSGRRSSSTGRSSRRRAPSPPRCGPTPGCVPRRGTRPPSRRSSPTFPDPRSRRLSGERVWPTCSAWARSSTASVST